MKKLCFFTIFFISFSLLSFVVLADSEWWDSAWMYRRNITINNSQNSEDLTNYQVFVNVSYIDDTNSHAQSAFDDLRFIDTDDSTVLGYWIENYVSESYADVWINISSIPASLTKDIYMYYGNPDATSASNFSNTFPFSLIKTIDKSLSYELHGACDFGPSEAKKDLLLMAFQNDVYSDQNMPVVNVTTSETVGNVVGYRPAGTAWSGDGTMIAVGQGGNHAKVRIYETDTWTEIHTIPYPGSGWYDSYPGFKGGEFLAVCWNYNRNMRIYNTSDWAQLKQFNDVCQVWPKFSPDGTRMATKYYTDVKIFNTSDPNPANWALLTTLTDPTGDVVEVAWYSDGSELVVPAFGSENKTYIYNTSDWDLITSFDIDSGRPYYSAYEIGLVISRLDVGLAGIYDPNDWSLVKEVGPGGTVNGKHANFNLNRNYLAVGFGTIAYIYKVREYDSPEPTHSIGSEETSADIPPKSFNVDQSKTDYILPKDVIEFYAYWTDDVGLSGYVFSTNVIQIDCSDGWDNSSWQEMTGTGNWSNYTWTIPSGCGGKSVEWKIYANDTSNNWNFTIPIKTFEVEPVGITTLVFKKEWNLISIPNKTVIDIIDDPCNIFSRGFYYYNASKGTYEVFSLEQLEGGNGYWMYSPSMDTCEVNVTVSGVTEVSHIPSLISGYNLIGAPSALTSASSLCSIIDGPYYWDADAQNWEEIDPMDTLESKMGYWLKCS